MDKTSQLDRQARAILARVSIDAAHPEPSIVKDQLDREMNELELLAALSEGRVSIDDIDDDTLERWNSLIGIENVAAILAASQHQALESDVHTISSRDSHRYSPPRILGIRRRTLIGVAALAAAASLAFVMLTSSNPPTSYTTSQKLSPVALGPKMPDSVLLRPSWSEISRISLSPPVLMNATADLPKAPPRLAAAVPTASTSNAAINPRTNSVPSETELLIETGVRTESVHPTTGAIPKWATPTVIIETRDGFGSGAIISPDGWILTNYHVIAPAVQIASLNASPPRVNIWTYDVLAGRKRPVEATIFRADPLRDLALLRLEKQGESDLPFYRLAENVKERDLCFGISLARGTSDWSLIPCEIASHFNHPTELTIALPVGEEISIAINRPRTAVVSTTRRITPSDYAGPLLNKDGQLVGLSFTASKHVAAGASASYISIESIRSFINEMPAQPDGIPFDILMAGFSNATLLRPVQVAADDAHPCIAVMFPAVKASDHQNQRSAEPDAVILFVKFDVMHNFSDRIPTPYGLWGQDDSGNFEFDFCMVMRKDGLRAAGYTDPSGRVNEIHIGRDTLADCIWSRDESGLWKGRTVSPQPLINSERLTARQLTQLAYVFEKVRHNQGHGENRAN